MALDPTAVIVSLITAVPATIGAVYAARGRRYAVEAAELGHDNKAKLHDLGNGVMDQKIYDAVSRVLDDRPEIVTDAQIVKAAVAHMLRRNSDAALAEAVENLLHKYLRT